jgi:activator of HSP90 ATPase
MQAQGIINIQKQYSHLNKLLAAARRKKSNNAAGFQQKTTTKQQDFCRKPQQKIAATHQTAGPTHNSNHNELTASTLISTDTSKGATPLVEHTSQTIKSTQHPPLRQYLNLLH